MTFCRKRALKRGNAVHTLVPVGRRTTHPFGWQNVPWRTHCVLKHLREAAGPSPRALAALPNAKLFLAYSSFVFVAVTGKCDNFTIRRIRDADYQPTI